MSSLSMLAIEIWALGALGLLLHRIRPRFGPIPLLLYAATMISTANLAEWLMPPVEPGSDLVFGIGGQVFVPIVLMIFLVVYVADGTCPAQGVLCGLTGVNLAQLIFLALLLHQQARNPEVALLDGISTAGSAIPEILWSAIARLGALVADMFTLTVFYQGMRRAPPGRGRWLAIGLSLVAALWVDAIVFNLLLYFGTPDLVALLSGDILTKTLAALMTWPLIVWYLARIAPQMPGDAGAEARPIFDIVFGPPGAVFQAEKLHSSASKLLDEAVTWDAQDESHEPALTQAENRTLYDFIRNAAHDLKNPLASIKLKIELLRRIKDDEGQARHLNDLDARVDHLVNLIDDLFALTYLNAIDALVTKPLDMNRLAHGVYQVMLPLAERKGLSLTVDFSTGDALMAQGDHDELARVLAALLVNAIDYTDVGSVTLRVARCDESVCVVSVSDTGRGIEVKDLARIFERGFRADAVVKANIEGTGLGLAIVKRVVDLHHGNIDVESAPGQGTTFTQTLPLAEANTGAD